MQFPNISADNFGSHFLPIAIAGAILSLSFLDMILELFSTKTKDSKDALTSKKEIWLASIAIVYAFLMPWIGFVATTGITASIILKIFGYENITRALAFGFVGALIVYLSFAYFMNVYLPHGVLN